MHVATTNNMYRLSHIIHHLDTEKQINHIQNTTLSGGVKLNPNYCDIETARCCSKLCEWIYNGEKDEEKCKMLPIHPRCHQYSNKEWIDIYTTRLNMDKTDSHIISFSILSPKVIPDTLFIIFAGTQISEQPLHVVIDLCVMPQPLKDPSNKSQIIAYVHSGIYASMKRIYNTIHSKHLSPENLQQKGIDLKQIKHIIVTGIHNNNTSHIYL